jgi:hypothetical protein
MKSLLVNSLYFSLFVQIITLFIGVFGLTLDVKPTDEILLSTVGLETLVSAVQFTFYVWYAYHFKAVSEAAVYRYYDWFITTPIMLFTTMLYYNYNNHPDKEETLQTFWETHQTKILIVFVCNAVMLYFGYLYEINVLNVATSIFFGFLGLIGSFYVVYDSFVRQNMAANLPLFTFMSVLWAFYGIAATFSPVWKNITYNFIDTLSKNFYGVFLTYVVYTKIDRPKIAVARVYPE